MHTHIGDFLSFLCTELFATVPFKQIISVAISCFALFFTLDYLAKVCCHLFFKSITFILVTTASKSNKK